MPARTKATTRKVIATTAPAKAPPAPVATREAAVIAALAQERAEAATPTVVRLQVTLTPGALEKLEDLVHALKRSKLAGRPSTSAVIEAAVLDLCERAPADVAEVVRRYNGEHAARRRRAT